MLDLHQYNSLGDALRAALETWPDETCLIEANRERENARYTYRQFKEAALPLASAMQRAGLANGTRGAMLLTNQSKWPISAYAIFYGGGVLVPLDYMLKPEEQIELLAHAKPEFLVIENHLWQRITKSPDFGKLHIRVVLVTEAPPNAELASAQRWEEFRDATPPAFVPRERKDAACIVYSSGAGGTPKGCVLTHDNYLEQCVALTSLFPFWPGVRYLSILPTNHAIDFMVGFIGPFTCGATVVHLRTLQPTYIREAFTKYKITYMALVPRILKELEKGLRERFAELPPRKRIVFNALVGVNRALTKKRPNLKLSRRLLKQVHDAFGGELRAFFVGGAFTPPATLQFFYDLGIPVGNGYGCTEAGTAITLNDFKPFRADTVGKALPGTKIEIRDADAEGVGIVAVNGRTVMSHYLDDPQLTAETIVDGWLITGDVGRIDQYGHLHLLGRDSNMIVTAEGKNVYPENVESHFDGVKVKDYCVQAANFVWPAQDLENEQLVLVLHPENGQSITPELIANIVERNKQLPSYKRVAGYLAWETDFPATATMKAKRKLLAAEIRGKLPRSSVVPL
ncbi:MAG TPA: AMP-binding protein [Candidatus Acidoferrales bacterium]